VTNPNLRLYMLLFPTHTINALFLRNSQKKFDLLDIPQVAHAMHEPCLNGLSCYHDYIREFATRQPFTNPLGG